MCVHTAMRNDNTNLLVFSAGAIIYILVPSGHILKVFTLADGVNWNSAVTNGRNCSVSVTELGLHIACYEWLAMEAIRRSGRLGFLQQRACWDSSAARGRWEETCDSQLD